MIDCGQYWKGELGVTFSITQRGENTFQLITYKVELDRYNFKKYIVKNNWINYIMILCQHIIFLIEIYLSFVVNIQTDIQERIFHFVLRFEYSLVFNAVFWMKAMDDMVQ